MLFMPVSAQRDNLELGIRYIKLGNSYRESGNSSKSIEFLEKGKKLVENRSEYWLAVAKEYYAYVFRDLGYESDNPDEQKMFLQNALDAFNEALAIYKRIIYQEDGSPIALESIMTQIHDINNDLQKIPDKISKKSLNKTNLSGANDNSFIVNLDRQKLKELPLLNPNIRSLSLSENRFNELPSTLGSMINLEYLDMSNNRLRNISEAIGQLESLHWLDLSKNRIKELPQSIGDLSNLKELDLSENRLKDLPVSICNLKQLEVLNLRNNQIPFEKISNIIKCLPNTNVMFDEYILKEAEEDISE